MGIAVRRAPGLRDPNEIYALGARKLDEVLELVRRSSACQQ